MNDSLANRSCNGAARHPVQGFKAIHNTCATKVRSYV